MMGLPEGKKVYVLWFCDTAHLFINGIEKSRGKWIIQLQLHMCMTREYRCDGQTDDR